jgi:DNA-binding FadR family transcriptional regulator
MRWLQQLFHDPMLDTILKEVRKMAGELDALKQQVTEMAGVEQSAVALIEGLHQRLTDAIAAGDPAALQALADDLKGQKDALAAAVAANPLP